jgi:staphylococcal nuclease domain-containing protein 1
LHAFESREFLRKLLVGKEITYNIEYTTSTNAREYGTVTLPVTISGETDLTRILVKEGMVRVRTVDGKKSPEYSYYR